MLKRSRGYLRLLVAAALAACVGLATAQEFPTKALRIIVAGSPGTTPDLVARVMGNELPKVIGQAVVVENKPGAAEIVGYEFVAKQVPADGYTMALVTVSSMALLPVITKDLRFDPLKDLVPVAGLTEGRLIFGSSAKMPWKTFSEFLANAKANPGKLNFGAATPSSRFPSLVLIHSLGLDIVHVPYSTGGPYLLGLVGGDVQMGFIGESSAISFGDRFRVLAVTGDQRRPPFMDIPTLPELGFSQIRPLSHNLSVPAATPKALIDRLYAAASKALQLPEVAPQFAKIGLEIVARTPEAAAKNLADENRVYAEAARKAGVRPE